MTQKEIEEAIEELDKRVERLRAMYDQYFLGIERLEPSVQRKDAERRFYQLRREKIRNTGVRFRFNQLCQRFTTYQTFWQRVARQIEEGTYRRDVMKVRQKLELQRLERRKDRIRRMGGAPEEEAIEVDVDVDVDADDGAGAADDPDSAWAAQALAEFDSEPAKRGKPRVQVHELAVEVSELTKALEEAEDPAAPSVLTFGKIARAKIEDDDEDEPTAAGQGKAAAPRAALGRIALRRVALAGDAPVVREESGPASSRDLAAERPLPPPPVRPTRQTGRGPALQDPVPIAKAPAPSPQTPARPVSPPPAVAPPAAAAAPGAGGQGDTDLRSLFLRRARPAAGPKPGAGAAAAPASDAAGLTKPRGAAAHGPAGGGDDNLPDDRVRAIYDQYRAARRQNNEGDVAYESVKKSIKEMLPKLRQKAPGRHVDFEVVIKDGKTVLKPVAK